MYQYQFIGIYLKQLIMGAIRMREVSFEGFIRNHYSDEIEESLSHYIKTNKDSIDFSLNKVTEPFSIDYDSTVIGHTYIVNAPGMDIIFDVMCTSRVFLENHKYAEDVYDKNDILFNVHCTLKNMRAFSITGIDPFEHHHNEEGHMSDTLVPYIYTYEYDSVACSFLKSVGYEHAIKVPEPIDPQKVISALNLQYLERSLSPTHSVLGRIYMYQNDNVQVFNKQTLTPSTITVSAGTVVIDPTAVLSLGEGSKNNTIIHECFHWFEHRKTFAFFKMCNTGSTNIDYPVAANPVDKTSPINWMERQARAIAPRILMPTVAFRNKTDELMKIYQNGYPDADLIDIMPLVITDLANFFRVSQCSAQIRLLDLGYTEVYGINNWADGHHVLPHRTHNKDAITAMQTFTISLDDARYLSVTDLNLRGLLSTGQYIFIDNHFVYKDPKYLEINKGTNKLSLTLYARTHMEECALLFDRQVASKNEYDPDILLYCVLNRTAQLGLEFKNKLASGVKMTEEENEKYMNDRKEIEEILRDMKNNFPDAFKVALKYSEMTQEDLEEKSGVSRQTISLYSNRDTNITKEKLMRLCIGMSLPYEISIALFDISPCPLRNTAQDLTYKLILETETMRSVEECNELLSKLGEKAL